MRANVEFGYLYFFRMTLMIISMVGLGACFYCKEQNIDFPGLSIIPLICLLLYMLAFGAGNILFVP